MSFNFEWIRQSHDGERDMEFINKYAESLKVAGFTIPSNYFETRPSIDSSEWVNKADQFIEVIRALIK
jgi:hypothetical protein